MQNRRPCAGMDRRQFLKGTTAVTALSASLVRSAAAACGGRRAGRARRRGSAAALGVPGPYPGRVIEVGKPDLITNGKRNQASIGQALAKGLSALTALTTP